MAFVAKGSDIKYRPIDTRRDTRPLTTIINEELESQDGAMYLVLGVLVASTFAVFAPFAGEFVLAATLPLVSKYTHPKLRLHDFPWRVPKHAKLPDGSKNRELGNVNVRKQPHKLHGEGVTYLGRCRNTGLPVYGTNSDDRTHMVVLGTTGSGKTEFLLGLIVNQFVQDSGFIMCDAKGDPSLQKEIYRLARRFGREDDLLTLNFITSGRDMIKAQRDKITNTFNMMSNTSSGMLIELIINLLDDSSGGGGDMWKGRAMAFIAALTRPLTYMRDMGFIQLSPATYIEFMELPALEELVFNHGGKYGKMFDVVLSPLRSYVLTLPGYNADPDKRKKQDQKTLEQHGFIVMQLTRAINDLTYNYGHIFGVQQGDIDMFDVVLNRRILTCPLPALEKSPDTLKMLGKLVVGSVKQMMAGSLGNRVEGLVREILDSRPTNSSNAFKLFLDEWGYIVVKGASVMPAQARSLNFSIVFAAQDFTDIKRGNAEEAEATWANSTVKAIGRITTGAEGETYRKASGFAQQEWQTRVTSVERRVGDFSDSYVNSNNLQHSREERLPYEDLAGQENGEFTLLLSKKTSGGDSAGVAVVRINGFYVKGKVPESLRLNDLSPIITIEKKEIDLPEERIKAVKELMNNFSVEKPDVIRSNLIAGAAYGDNVSEDSKLVTDGNVTLKVASSSKQSPFYKDYPNESILYSLSQDYSDSGEVSNLSIDSHEGLLKVITEKGRDARKQSATSTAKFNTSRISNSNDLSEEARKGVDLPLSSAGSITIEVPSASFKFSELETPQATASVNEMLTKAGYQSKERVSMSLLSIFNRNGGASNSILGGEAVSQAINIQRFNDQSKATIEEMHLSLHDALKSAFDQLSKIGEEMKPEDINEANNISKQLMKELPNLLSSVRGSSH